MLKVGNVIVETTAISQGNLLLALRLSLPHIDTTKKTSVMCQALLMDQSKVEDEPWLIVSWYLVDDLWKVRCCRLLCLQALLTLTLQSDLSLFFLCHCDSYFLVWLWSFCIYFKHFQDRFKTSEICQYFIKSKFAHNVWLFSELFLDLSTGSSDLHQILQFAHFCTSTAKLSELFLELFLAISTCFSAEWFVALLKEL